MNQERMEIVGLHVPEYVSLLKKITQDVIKCPEMKLDSVFHELGLTYFEIHKKVSNEVPEFVDVTSETTEWRLMVTAFYCLQRLEKALRERDLMSVQQTVYVKNATKVLTQLGILRNSHPSLSHYQASPAPSNDVVNQYYILRATVCFFYKFSFNALLRFYTFSHIISDLLVGFLQLLYCPLKKPQLESNIQNEGFVMTQTFYDEVLKNRMNLIECFQKMEDSVTPTLFLREIMALFLEKSPKWFKNGISTILNNYLKRDSGLVNILITLLDGVLHDETFSWRPIQIVEKIVTESFCLPHFETHIYPQITDLLLVDSKKHVGAVRQLYASIVKSMMSLDENKGLHLLEKVFEPLMDFSEKEVNSIDGDKLNNAIILIHYIFLDRKCSGVPYLILVPFIPVLFEIYHLIYDNPGTLQNDLREILQFCLKSCDRDMFEILLFQRLRNDFHLFVNGDKLVVTCVTEKGRFDVVKRAHVIFSISKSAPDITLTYFTFLLHCLTNSDKYFGSTSLLEEEDEGYLSTFERKLAVYEMLTILSKEVTKISNFTDKIYDQMILYFNVVLTKALSTRSYNSADDEMYQLVFMIVMILEHFVDHKKKCMENSTLRLSLEKIYEDCNDGELKSMICKTLNCSENKKEKRDIVLDAIEECFDPCIATKGHGLITLEKLVINKNEKAVEKKQYILNIFKENLTNTDTYIYLSAIKGVAAMINIGTEFTQQVLETLCDEYVEAPKEELGSELRLKIGEILVQVTKQLNELVPLHKTLLLNSFLLGTKDDDHLVRASALANIGEICAILGYKMGTISSEILYCVDCVIRTDKSLEPRRAAMLLIRQFFAGMGIDMLETMQSDLVQVYRNVKDYYRYDKDDVLALQAQLTLEEINDNMKKIINRYMR